MINEELIIEEIKKDVKYYFSLTEQQKLSEVYIKLVLMEDGDLLEKMSKKVKRNKELVQLAIEQNPLSIRYSSFRGNKEMVLKAMSKNPFALFYADKVIKEDEAMLELALRKRVRLFFTLNDFMSNNKKLVKIALEQRPQYYKWVGANLQKDKDILLMVSEYIKNNQNAFSNEFALLLKYEQEDLLMEKLAKISKDEVIKLKKKI